MIYGNAFSKNYANSVEIILLYNRKQNTGMKVLYVPFSLSKVICYWSIILCMKVSYKCTYYNYV
jgi:hypothetical protein